MVKRRRGRMNNQSSPLTSCLLAREAISALIDGEEPPLSEAITAAHIARCAGCEAFRTGVLSLAREMRVRAFDPAPDGPGDVLERLGCADRVREPTLDRTHFSAQKCRRSWARASGWAIGIAPVGFAVPALALGVFAHIHVVPSHVLTPCTLGLHHVSRR
jgi:predicted anti-sigma-YlaC factor YlaD